nr:hypothetical protein [Tanacetum cinerariifolium]
NLVRRGINVDSCVCPICSTGEDEINHILFRCDLAQQHGGIYGGLGTASFLREFFPDVPRGSIEQVQMEDLKSYLESTILSSMLDRWRMSFSGYGEFLVSSVRSLIDDKIMEVVDPKNRWIKYMPIKDNILAWRIKLDYLPTRLNLSRRSIDLESIFCASCNLAVESLSHIFFACSMVKDLYKNIAPSWDVNMTELSSYEEWWN